MCHHSNYSRDKSHIACVTEKYYGSKKKIEILKHNDKIECKPHWSTYIYICSKIHEKSQPVQTVNGKFNWQVI